ncbi:HDOD domain-containing protein, partial [Aliarcobacter butzleri]
PEEFKEKAKILDVIKTATCIKEPLSNNSIKKALKKAKKYGFDTKILENAILNLKQRIDLGVDKY